MLTVESVASLRLSMRLADAESSLGAAEECRIGFRRLLADLEHVTPRWDGGMMHLHKEEEC